MDTSGQGSVRRGRGGDACKGDHERAHDEGRPAWAIAVLTAIFGFGCTPKTSTPEPISSGSAVAISTEEATAPAPSAASATPPGPPREQPTPPALASAVESVGKVGKRIYRHDVWAATATDLALAKTKLRSDRTIKGWVIEERAAGAGAVVHFVRAGTTSAIRISFPGDDEQGATLETTAKPLTPELVVMAKARETAIASPFRRLARVYNTVIFPASALGAGEPGFLVYLLAADERPGELALGGHVRVHVSPDGMTATTIMPLSKTIVRVPLDERAGGPPARGIPFVTHLLGDTPNEGHVWTSLSVKKPLFVGTRAGMWNVDGAKIAFFGALPPPPAP